MSDKGGSNSMIRKGNKKMAHHGTRPQSIEANSHSHGQCSGEPMPEHQSTPQSRMDANQLVPPLNLMQDPKFATPSPAHLNAKQEGQPSAVDDSKGRPSTVESAAPINNSVKVLLKREGTQGCYPNLPATTHITKIIRNKIPSFYPTWRKIPEKIRRDLFQQWKKYVQWAPCDEEFMWKAFNKKASSRLSSMYRECKKKMKPADWMGESFWRALQEHWETYEFKMMSESNKKNRASKVGGSVHTDGCVEGALKVGHIDSNTQQSMLKAWKTVAGGKKKGHIYGLSAYSEESVEGPPENIGSSAAWESQIQEMNCYITRMNKELRGIATTRELDEIREQLTMMNRTQMVLLQLLEQISASPQPWGMMHGYAQSQAQQPWGMPQPYTQPQPQVQQQQSWPIQQSHPQPPSQSYPHFTQQPYIPPMDNSE